MLGPDVLVALSLDQLCGNPYPIACLPHAAFEHIAHPEIASDLFHVDRTAFVSEARIACDHEQRGIARERGGDVLGYAIGEKLLLGVAAHVGEREHGHRGLVGHCERCCGRLIRWADGRKSFFFEETDAVHGQWPRFARQAAIALGR